MKWAYARSGQVEQGFGVAGGDLGAVRGGGVTTDKIDMSIPAASVGSPRRESATTGASR